MPQPPLLCCQFTADKKCPGVCFAWCCDNLAERGETLLLRLEGVGGGCGVRRLNFTPAACENPW